MAADPVRTGLAGSAGIAAGWASTQRSVKASNCLNKGAAHDAGVDGKGAVLCGGGKYVLRLQTIYRVTDAIL